MIKHLIPRLSLAALVASFTIACTGPDQVTGPDLAVSAARASTTTTSPVVTGASPSMSARNVTLNVRILGSGFDRGSKAQWALKGVPSSKVTTNSTTYVSSKELTANITVAADADIAYYDIIVTTSSGKPGIGTETFEIVVETTDLGTLGGNDAEALAVNDAGVIVGGSTTRAGVNRPFLWDGVMRDLGLPAGGTWGRATGLNNTGTVVGEVAVNGYFRPYIWTSTTGPRTLPVPADKLNGYASAVNDGGTVVGSYGPGQNLHAAIWQNGVLIDIHPVSGGTSDAFSISAAGDVVGYYNATGQGNSVPFVRTAAGEVRFLPCPVGGVCSAAAISGLGDIVGSVTLADGTSHAYRWNDRGVGTHGVIGGAGTGAFAVSDGGFVAGSFAFSIWDNDGAALWGSDAVMNPLQSESKSIPARGSARGVNSSGWAVGWAYKVIKGAGYHRAVRWRMPIV